jgi:hypothetical protein
VLLVGAVVGTACTGPQGEQGADGAGIQDVVSNADGTITFTLTNGQTYTTNNLTGLQGPQGEQGIQGPTGDTGAQGPQGIQGVQGDTGPAGAGVQWRGEWSSSTTYIQNDAVAYQGSSYISKQNANTNHVPTDTTWWALWVEKGDTGAQGIQGVQGIQGPQGEPGGLAWGTPVLHGPDSYDLGTGEGFYGLGSLSPGDRVTFTFTVEPSWSGGANYLVMDPYGNFILNGNGGLASMSGGGGFIAALSGSHFIWFDVYSNIPSTVSVSWTYYPHL